MSNLVKKMDKKQIVELIKANPQLNYEQFKAQAIKANVSLSLFEQAWQETRQQNRQPSDTITPSKPKKKIVFVFIALTLAITSYVGYYFFLGMDNDINDIITFNIEERTPDHVIDDDFTPGPQFILSASTKKIYSCLLPINSEVKVDKNLIKVIIKGSVKEVDVSLPPSYSCAQAFGPASFSKKLDINEGEFILEIYLEPKTDKYKLTVTKERVEINEIQSSFSKFSKNELARTPSDVIAATCSRYKYECENVEAVDEACPIFFNEIEKIAKPISDKTIILTSCSEEKYNNGECKVYSFNDAFIKLEALFEASYHYDLGHGYESSCRKGEQLYNKEIKTSHGPISDMKCETDKRWGIICESRSLK